MRSTFIKVYSKNSIPDNRYIVIVILIISVIIIISNKDSEPYTVPTNRKIYVIIIALV